MLDRVGTGNVIVPSSLTSEAHLKLSASPHSADFLLSTLVNTDLPLLPARESPPQCPHQKISSSALEWEDRSPRRRRHFAPAQ